MRVAPRDTLIFLIQQTFIFQCTDKILFLNLLHNSLSMKRIRSAILSFANARTEICQAV